jgi:hypothetical protein
MSEDIKEAAETKLPEPLTSSEKESFEARISELEVENSALRAENDELKKPKPEPVQKEGRSAADIAEEWLPKPW